MLVADIVVRDLPSWVHENRIFYSSCVAGAISEERYIAGLVACGLVDAEVRNRLVYDATQLKAFINSELPEVELNRMNLPEDFTSIAESFVGKIWSAKIYAKKPMSG